MQPFNPLKKYIVALRVIVCNGDGRKRSPTSVST